MSGLILRNTMKWSEKMKFKDKYIGDKAFYSTLLVVVVPLIIQNTITNFVSLIDNIMIGRIGTEQMSGVAIVNQLLFVFNICIFGITSAVGIFGTQFYGSGNEDGVREAFRLKVVASGLFAVLAIAIFNIFGKELISLFLSDTGTGENLELTLKYGLQYLGVMIWQIIPFTIIQIYSSTLRERGSTIAPMVCGFISVFVNCCLNAVLIYGLLGAPALGVKGAAIATLIARIAELVAIMGFTHLNKTKYTFVNGLFRSWRISRSLIVDVLKMGTPLILNEVMWSIGMTMLNQCYSTRGLNIIAALNISTTLSNMFNVVFISMGNAAGIIVGQQLGAGKHDKAKDTARKLIFISVSVCVLVGALLFITSGAFPAIYKTSGEVKRLATNFIRISSIFMPVLAFVNLSYFIMRSGGKTFVTFLFDSCFVWVVVIPVIFCLTRFTGLGIVLIYFICQSLEMIKCLIGYGLLKKGVWINRIV